MKKRFKDKNHIRYSNVYEESNSLLSFSKGNIYLSVCSGLDNTLALLLNNPKKIVCFDYNIAQIHLAKLKIVAFKYLSYNELLKFFGINSIKKERINIYKKLKEKLDKDTKDYFDKYIDYIKVGLIYSGKFEYYLSLVKKYILPFTHNKKIINKFMNVTTIEKQRAIYKEFNNKRFRKLFNIFFSEKTMSKLGREKIFFKYIDKDLSSNLKTRIDLGFNNVLNINNPYMQYIILGKFISLPEYLKEENYEVIKENLDKIELIECDFKEAITKEKYDFLNLSDIFEYMTEEETQECEELIIKNTNPNARVVFWNMMVQRTFKQNKFKLIDSYETFIKERPFFYQNLWRYEKND